MRKKRPTGRPALPKSLVTLRMLRRAGALSHGMHGVDILPDDDCGHWQSKACACDVGVKVRWSQRVRGEN
jgi:hypothetical protein